MKDLQENVTNYLGRALFVVLFFLLLGTFSDNTFKPSSFPVKIQSIAELHSDCVIADAGQLPLFQKNWVSFGPKTSFQRFTSAFKSFIYNRTITQRFIVVQKSELSIKPPSYFRFYLHLFPKDSDEVPILG